MKITYDPEKKDSNLLKHKVDFDDVRYFDWSTAIIGDDTRQNYGETRYIAVGKIGERLHVLIYTIREHNIRIISLRKANNRERIAYEKRQ
jgi:uncharacterized DUF497 family protein